MLRAVGPRHDAATSLMRPTPAGSGALQYPLMSDPLVLGLTGEVVVDVTPARTAEAFGSGLVPVFATPALVGLVETAAVRALEGRLPPDQTTVGTRIEISHLAATPVGARVRAAATLAAVDGRRLTFTVAAHDEHEQIGEGRHERMIVSREKFMARVSEKQRRATKPGGESSTPPCGST